MGSFITAKCYVELAYGVRVSVSVGEGTGLCCHSAALAHASTWRLQLDQEDAASLHE